MSKKSKGGGRANGAKKAEKAKKPKGTCCVSDKRCQRCPIRMLRDGTLPQGYTVKKRKLVKAA